MAAVVHNRSKRRMTDYFAGRTLKAMLLNGYVDNPDHSFVSDISASEIAGSGYARATLGSITSTQDDTNELAVLDCADIAFGAVGPAGGQAITKLAIFDDAGGADSAREILAVYDCAATLNGGTFTVIINTNGLLRVS